jgi:hypothetical protein
VLLKPGTVLHTSLGGITIIQAPVHASGYPVEYVVHWQDDDAGTYNGYYIADYAAYPALNNNSAGTWQFWQLNASEWGVKPNASGNNWCGEDGAMGYYNLGGLITCNHSSADPMYISCSAGKSTFGMWDGYWNDAWDFLNYDRVSGVSYWVVATDLGNFYGNGGHPDNWWYEAGICN